LIGMLFNVMQGLLLYGLVGWLPSFLVKQGMTIASSLWYTTLMALGGLVGAGIGAMIADRVGRKTVIVSSSLIAAAFAVAFSHAGNGLLLPALGFCMVTSIYVFIAVGIAVRLPELFPTRYRLRGIGVCSATGRLATSGIQFAVLWIFSWGGMAAVVGTITAALLLQALLVAVFDVETSRRSLEDAVAASRGEAGGLLDDALPSAVR
jgi:MFS transporter, putative metabolite:H+ symporter